MAKGTEAMQLIRMGEITEMHERGSNSKKRMLKEKEKPSMKGQVRSSLIQLASIVSNYTAIALWAF